MTATGFTVRVTSLFFLFKSASLVLKQIPACTRKHKTNAFGRLTKYLHWLLLVVLDGFRSFKMILGRFSSFLDHFSSF